jgi:hypothetical protein
VVEHVAPFALPGEGGSERRDRRQVGAAQLSPGETTVGPVPHGTPGLTPRERLAARAGHYLAFTLLFLALYGGVVVALGRFPEPLLLAILVASFAKDLYDEVRLRRGGMPLGYAGIEHAPSNAVLIAMILGGVVTPVGTVGGVPVETLSLALATVDLLFDLSQDLRA